MVACGAGRATAGPVLFTIDKTEGTGVSPLSPIAPVEILLEHDPGVVPLELTQIGLGILWDDGDSGTVDFTSETDPNFDTFVAGLTNGVDDFISVLVEWPDQGGGGGGATESSWGFGSPDLFGYEIDLILLTVHDVQIDPWMQDGFYAEVDLTYEFYGSLIPEPTTLTLLAVGVVGILRRRSRFCNDEPVTDGRGARPVTRLQDRPQTP